MKRPALRHRRPGGATSRRLPRAARRDPQVERAVAADRGDVRRDGDAALRALHARASTACASRPRALRVPAGEIRAPRAARRPGAGRRAATHGAAHRGLPPPAARPRASGCASPTARVLEEVVRAPRLGGPLRSRRRRRLSVVGADERDPGPGRRRAAHRGGHAAARPSRRTRRWPRRSSSPASRRAVYRVGGAQAVAALAYGTRAMPRGGQDRRPRQRVRGRGQAAGARRRRDRPRGGAERGRGPGRRHRRRRLGGGRPAGPGRARQRRRDRRSRHDLASARPTRSRGS